MTIKKTFATENLHWNVARGKWVPVREASIFASAEAAAEMIRSEGLLGEAIVSQGRRR